MLDKSYQPSYQHFKSIEVNRKKQLHFSSEFYTLNPHLNAAEFIVFELILHHKTIKKAHNAFQRFDFNDGKKIGELIKSNIEIFNVNKNDWWIEASTDKLILHYIRKLALNRMENIQHLDFTAISEKTGMVLFTIDKFLMTEIADEKNPDVPIITRDEFEQIFNKLVEDGIIGPEKMKIAWGDLRRKYPICPFYGMTRGTPIDRYYLQKFIRKIKKEVTGKAIEFGGTRSEFSQYQFSLVNEYLAVDIIETPEVDIVGNIFDKSLFKNNSCDSIIIFNVLEHLDNPDKAIDNMNHWLKPGGKIFCMVPNAQRVHFYPKDYWRFMPDGLAELFKKFKKTHCFVYGNLTSTIASLMGISVEELSTRELDECNPYYPVATCLIAQK